jgi:hypothetical protein
LLLLFATAGRHEEYYAYYGQDATGIGRPGDRSFSIRRNMDRAGIDEFFAMGKAKSGPDEHDQAGGQQYDTECFLHRTNIRNLRRSLAFLEPAANGFVVEFQTGIGQYDRSDNGEQDIGQGLHERDAAVFA